MYDKICVSKDLVDHIIITKENNGETFLSARPSPNKAGMVEMLFLK